MCTQAIYTPSPFEEEKGETKTTTGSAPLTPLSGRDFSRAVISLDPYQK